MTLISQLNTLESAGLVRLAATQPELEYLFRHALVQDAAYQSLLKQDRKQLHATVGVTLEQLFPDQIDELAATLAYHYEKAEVRDKAVRYLRRAGDRARSSYANAEAIAFYQAALGQIAKLGAEPAAEWLALRIQLYEDMGDLLELTGHHQEARDQYEAAQGLIAAAQRVGRARLRRKLGYTWMIQAQHEKAMVIFDEVEAILGTAPTTPADAWWQEWIQLQLDRVWLRYVRNEVAELTALIEKTRPVLDQFGLPAQRFGFYRGLVLSAFRRDRYQISNQSLADAQMGLTHAQASNQLSSLAEGLFFVGICHALREEWSAGEENLLAAVQLAERIGNNTTLARSLAHLTNLYRRHKQVAEAKEFNARLYTAAESGQLREYIAAAQANAAWLAWRAGELDTAQQLAEAALGYWQQIPLIYPFQWATLLPLLALALTQDRVADAVEYARKLIAPAQGRLPHELTQTLADAVQAAEQSQTETARARLAQAIRLAQETGYL